MYSTHFLIIKPKTMSTNFKNKILLLFLIITGLHANSQFQTIELPRQGTNINSLGPSTANLGPVSMVLDPQNDGSTPFSSLTGSQVTSVTFKLVNQQYTGLTYTGLNTGLAFGASPTTAVANPPGQPAGQQTVDPLNLYQNLGYFAVAPGGPTNNFYSSHPTIFPGTGIITGATAITQARQNGAATIFTAAQVQYDQGIQNNPSPVPTTFNSSTRHYYGDLVIEFNRFITNPVIHIAGLGGSYFYLPVGAGPASDPNQWRRSHFTTELESIYSLTQLSGNTYFTVSGGNIRNSAAKPDGASVSTTISPSDPFDHLGAASGSVRLNGVYRTIVLKVYLRGSDITDAVREFAWSAPGSASNNDPATLRNPLTGDIWLVSVSTEPAQLIPLPATGMNLNAALNGSDVQLSWKTLSEINTKEFAIERSTDGINFSVIGTKESIGNSAVETNYSLVDANMQVPVYYYRLKLYDIDGAYKYSNVAVVRKSGSIKGIRVFPNPAINQLNVEFNQAKGDYMISLFNQAGQEVSVQRAIVQYNVQYISLNRNGLPAGSYIMNVRNTASGEAYSEKVILQ